MISSRPSSAPNTRGNTLAVVGNPSDHKESVFWKYAGPLLFGAGVLYSAYLTRQKMLDLGTKEYLRHINREHNREIIVFATCLLFLILTLRPRRVFRMEVFEQGVRIQQGKKEYSYAYKEITHLSKALGGSDANITIYALGGEKQMFFRIPINASKTLAEQYATFHLPQVLKDFDQGRPIEFGELNVTKEGLLFNEKLISREEIKKLQVKKDATRILNILDTNGKILEKINRNRIYDEFLFTALLEYKNVPYL